MTVATRIIMAALTLSAMSFGVSTQPRACWVTLTQDPEVMRIGEDNFRITFGLEATTCKRYGCAGLIHYRTIWQAEGGTRTSELRSVSFDIPSGAERSLTVDSIDLDAGAAHASRVVSIEVVDITCTSNRQTKLAGR